MSPTSSAHTHQRLLESLPVITGRPVAEWITEMEQAPGLLRFQERVAWLRDMHELPHGHASAIVHECDLRRSRRVMQ